MPGFRLNAHQFKTLKDVIINEFSVGDLEDLLLDVTDDGIYLNKIINPVGAQMHDIARAVILKGQDDGWLLEFIQKAHKERATNLELSQLVSELKPQIQAAHADPLQSCCLSTSVIMLDRDDLRKELDELHQRHKRVLVVNGQPYSGKTYSEELIYHLRDWPKSDFVTITCDLLVLEAEIRLAAGTQPAPPEISAYDLGKFIFKQITTSTELPQPGELSEGQWNFQFLLWFNREFREMEKVYWIILDHFQKVPLSQGAYDFILTLVKSIHKDITCLRLVLLEYERVDDLDATIPNPIGKESIPVISEKHLYQFFEMEYESRYQSKQTKYNEDNVVTSVARVWNQIDPGAASWMRQLSKVVEEEQKKIREGKV